MRSPGRTSRRAASGRAQRLGSLLCGSFAVLLVTTPLMLPETLVHQHTSRQAPCAGEAEGVGAADRCRDAAAEANTRDAPLRRAPAQRASASAAAGLCLSCAQSVDKAQSSRVAIEVASSGADSETLHIAPAGFAPDTIAGDDAPARAPPIA